ncbi:MAG: hypothetical protein U0V75_17505 [Ferruginibacter sp.]
MSILFSSPAISIAATTDAASITYLLNSAYRGESSKKGWTTEAHLIDGNTRSTEAEVQQVMKKEGSVFLKHTGKNGSITGCVNLQLQQENYTWACLLLHPNCREVEWVKNY